MEAISLIKSNFQEYIDQGVTLVEFWAPSCEHCKLQLPIIDELAEKFKHQAIIARVNVHIEKELEAEYGVTSTPTLIIFKDGYRVEKLEGFQSQDLLIQKIKLYTSIGDTC
ncbi:thioredoxin 1 [Paenibacillus sp. UNC496MF]|uniref:thioredoxin family protein n=1 Tax=Paenibacillus sp. UNC496MF TaxID=1502753 RepID=UPI0008EBE68A|nr:thioredoxin family protein [Paenibacillus sp. UNC496MF]SFJ60220.1 thioredoxin 1 [Paenibacillus sp. UNC496MF]